MAQAQIAGSTLGSSLESFLCCEEIVPGAIPSYDICKLIYLYHPLGKKMAEVPIAMAQSMPRDIVVPDGPEEDLRDAFVTQWRTDGVNTTIRNTGTQSRVYGIASMALLEKGVDSAKPIEIKKLFKNEISFNVLDPLNTAGSLVLNQDPNAMDFQKHRDIAVNGIRYHRSRTVTIMNEQPIYIAWTSSAFGFVGRSVYQRALFPLKSFVQTMRADDMVARKVGLIVAMLVMASNIVDKVMAVGAAFKRKILQIGSTDNVISISKDEDVKSLDLTNLEGPLNTVRTHILENIAAAADMPAKMLNNETFAEGFGEGTEDAKAIAGYIDSIREWLSPLYDFMDMVTQRRAWNEDFFKVMQNKYPEQYASMVYEDAFYKWSNSFKATWPSLLREPESEQVRVEDTKLKAMIAAFQVLTPLLDPMNKAKTIQWVADNFNATTKLFTAPLNLDYDILAKFIEEQKQQADDMAEAANKEPEAAPPFSARDSSVVEMVEHRVNNVEQFLRKHGRQIARITAR